jgi:hypothetical protein
MNNSERQGLEQSMMIVVRNGKTIQRSSKKMADPLLGNDAKNEIEPLASFAISGLEIEERNQSL